MIKLLKIEWYKIASYKTFWVIFVLHFILLGIVSTTMEKIMGSIASSKGDGPNPATLIVDAIPIFNFPSIYHNLAYIFSWFAFFLAILVIILVCNEFKYRTLRQNIIDGLSKWEVIFAKEFIIVTMSVISCMALLVTSLLLGSGDNMLWGIEGIAAYFLGLLLYLNFAFFIAIALKNSGLSIGVLIIYSIVENVFSTRIPEYISQYFPINLMSEILPNPMSRLMGSEAILDLSIVNVALVFVYVIIFLFSSHFLLQRGHAG